MRSIFSVLQIFYFEETVNSIVRLSLHQESGHEDESFKHQAIIYDFFSVPIVPELQQG
jgi:hypothetical protein